MRKQHQTEASHYSKLNDYLSSGNYSNEQLYEYLVSSRNQLPFNSLASAYPTLQHVAHEHKIKWSADMIKNIQFPLEPEGELPHWDEHPILKKAEQHIFDQVISITSQIAALEAELAKSNAEVGLLNQKLVDLQEHFEQRLCQQAQRERGLTIEPSKIAQIKAEREKIQQRIQLTKLLSSDIEALTFENVMKNNHIRQQIETVSQSLNNSMIANTKTELQMDIQSVKSKIAQQKKKQMERSSRLQESSKQQLLRCLTDRLKLQESLQHEQLQKREFFELLSIFKVGFRKVKQNNKKLKQELARRGLSLPMPTKRQGYKV